MDLLGDCAVFAEHETPEALAEAISLLMDDRMTAHQVGRSRISPSPRPLFMAQRGSKKLVDAYENLEARARSRAQGLSSEVRTKSRYEFLDGPPDVWRRNFDGHLQPAVASQPVELSKSWRVIR